MDTDPDTDPGGQLNSDPLNPDPNNTCFFLFFRPGRMVNMRTHSWAGPKVDMAVH